MKNPLKNNRLFVEMYGRTSLKTLDVNFDRNVKGTLKNLLFFPRSHDLSQVLGLSKLY